MRKRPVSRGNRGVGLGWWVRPARPADIERLSEMDVTVASPGRYALQERRPALSRLVFALSYRPRQPFWRGYEWDWADVPHFEDHVCQGWVWVAETFPVVAGPGECPDRHLTGQGSGPAKLVGVIEVAPAPASARVWGHEPERGWWELLSCFVDVSWRRRGVGRALVERAVHEVARRQGRLLFTQAEAGNGGALRFYLHQGFRLQGLSYVESWQREQGEAAVLLVRPVSPC